MTNWQEISRCFAALRPSQWVDPKVTAYLESVSTDRPILVACSGGADSVFLTLALVALYPSQSRRFQLVHYNHGIRGKAADADAAFVEELGRGLGLPVEIGQSVDRLSPDEASLRKARYQWFLEVYFRENASALVLGQHGDDVLESLLMGVLSGSGPAGLASPMPVRTFPDGHSRLRPLLSLKREQIIKTLETLEIPWREDASNQDKTYTRNWLRAEIIPALRTRFPQEIYSATFRTRKLMEECVATLDTEIAALQLDESNPSEFFAQQLAGRSEGLVRRALMAWWIRHHADNSLSAAATDALVEVISRNLVGAKIPVGKITGAESVAQVLEWSKDGVLFLAPEHRTESEPWSAPAHWQWLAGPLFLPDGAALSAELVELSAGDESPYKAADPYQEAWLSGVDGTLYVRQWQPGDRYQPLGSPGRRKLQDLFGDAKLNSEQKQGLPVILNEDGAIVWVPGFPPADAFKICQNDKSALQLTYNPQFTGFPKHHGG